VGQIDSVPIGKSERSRRPMGSRDLLGLRYSLRSLSGAVTFVAASLASLLHPWRIWCPALVFTGVLLLVAILCSICARGRRRAFWMGFAVVTGSTGLLGYRPDKIHQHRTGRVVLSPQIIAQGLVCLAVDTNHFGPPALVIHELRKPLRLRVIERTILEIDEQE
jgi:hypothetical protein